MVDFASVFAATAAATFVPFVVGLYIPVAFKKPGSQWLGAVAVGVMMWFFVDVMNDASQLGVNSGFPIGFSQVGLVLAFVFGLAILFRLDSGAGPSVFAWAAIAALGISFHAVGEGIVIGAAVPTSSDIITAIGGYGPAAAYVVHKVLEGFVVGVVAMSAGRLRNSQLFALLLVGAIPTMIGTFLGAYTDVDPRYFFAFGATATIYVVYKLAPNLKSSGLRVAVAILIGFFFMYGAGLLHGLSL